MTNVPESASRRVNTSSTTNTELMAFESASTITPTGRVSKAKTDKRVHACGLEGGGKVSLARTVSCVLHFYFDFTLTHDRSSLEQSTDDDMN